MAANKRREEARKLFDLLMEFFQKEQEVPSEFLEKVDEVANYLGDIAEGRKQ